MHSDAVFERYSAYYDLLYRDKDYVAEADYVVRTLRGSDSAVQTLLELGAGTGKHGRLLAQRGFEVTGIERSQLMVAAAQREGGSGNEANGRFDCVVGDIRTIDVKREFDAIIALFHVISYQTTNEDVLRTFQNAARHVKRGGLFLFDVWHGPAVLTERPTVRVKRMQDNKTELIRTAEPSLDVDASTVGVHYTVFVRSKGDDRFDAIEEHHRVRYFFPTEIQLLADQTGFSVEKAEEFLSGALPTDRTWGVAYLLRKQP